MFSRKSQYAFHALIILCEIPPGERRTIEQIANSRHLPKKFLEIILRELKDSGIVKSTRGKKGGYMLARPAGEIRIQDVVNVTENTHWFTCLYAEAGQACGNCFDATDCLINRTIQPVREQIVAYLSSRSLLDLAHSRTSTVLGSSA